MKEEEQIVELVNQPTPEVVKKCNIKDVLPASVIELLQSAPGNETVRAVVLAHVKQPIPDTCLTFEQARDWIEETIEKPIHETSKLTSPATTISFRVSVSENVSGRCDFSARSTGEGSVPISIARLIELAGEYDDMESFMDAIYREVLDYCDDYVETEIDYDSTDHENYSVNDSHGTGWDFYETRTVRIAAIREALSAHAPEVLERLDGND